MSSEYCRNRVKEVEKRLFMISVVVGKRNLGGFRSGLYLKWRFELIKRWVLVVDGKTQRRSP